MAQLPPGIRFIISFSRDQWYRAFIFILTFLLYASFHLSRKPISIVKGELHSYCTASNDGKVGFSRRSQKARDALAHQLLDNGTDCGWAPFDQDNYQQLLGALDYSFLCAYAIGMYLSGIIGERLPIRCYLTFGMLASGAFTALFGVGYFYNIHSFGFYVITQIINGLVQTTGWPSVVTCLGNWFGKGRRGLIMGVWNSHTSVGNILGSLIAGYWVSTCWGLSFIVPGAIVAAMGILCFLFLIEHPKDIACSASPASLRRMEEHPCAEGVPALVCVTWAGAESFPLLSPPESSRSPWGASFSRSRGESGLPFLFPTLKGIRSEGETGLISGDVSSDSTTVSKFSFPQEFCSLPVGPWRDMVEGKGGLPEGPQRPGAEAELGCFPIGSVPSHMPLIMSRALCKAASARPFTGADFWAQPRPGNFPSKGLLFSMQFLFFQFFKVFVTEILKHVRK